MEPLYHLQRHPFIRFIVPLIVGIACHTLFNKESSNSVVWCLFLSATVCILSSIRIHQTNYAHKFRWVFGVGITLFFLGYGLYLIHQQTERTLFDWKSEAGIYEVRLTDMPEEKSKSILYSAFVLHEIDSVTTHPVGRQVMLYLAKDSLAKLLRVGDRLLISTHISSPTNGGNPEEFDYAGFLLHKGISGTAFVPTKQWKIIGHDVTVTLKQIALSYREKLLNIYRKLGFSGDEFAVLSALTVGYKEELSMEIRTTYSTAGASHVLALSGLHIGILYLLFNTMVRLLKRNKYLNIASQCLIIFILWAFAFVSGLSPSVVRSVTMFSIIALSQLWRKHPITLNTIAFTAFAMLIYQPFYLYDLSFQLSFAAVTGIVVFQPKIDELISEKQLLPMKNPLIHYVWGIISVSIVAQLATAPLIMYYFSNLPSYFLLTNLIAIPMVSLIICLAILMVCLGFFPPIQQWIAFVLQWLLHLLNGALAWVEQLPHASVSGIWLHPASLVVLYLLLVSAGFYLVFQKRKMLFISLSSILTMILLHLIIGYQQRDIRAIIFYNNPATPCVHLIHSRKESYIAFVKEGGTAKDLRFITERFWNKLKLAPPVILPTDTIHPFVWKRQNILSFDGKTICLLNDDFRRIVTRGPLFPVDYLFVSNSYHGKLKEVGTLFRVKTVILDSSLSPYRLQTLEAICQELKLDYISISSKGSWRIAL